MLAGARIIDVWTGGFRLEGVLSSGAAHGPSAAHGAVIELGHDDGSSRWHVITATRHRGRIDSERRGLGRSSEPRTCRSPVVVSAPTRRRDPGRDQRSTRRSRRDPARDGVAHRMPHFIELSHCRRRSLPVPSRSPQACTRESRSPGNRPFAQAEATDPRLGTES